MTRSQLNATASALILAASLATAQTEGVVLEEVWTDLAGGAVADLTASAKYAQTADEVKTLERFSVESTGEMFGARYTALLMPPTTGQYTFWIASDDSSELRLSTDDDPANCRTIARVNGWTGRDEWGKGPEWTKMWWVWQKLDDRYGPTWYPRWYWVRTTRWADEPGHTETWEEMIEDMSLAVGEDLFPFFRKIGTTLNRDRLERIDFQGETLKLPIAPLDTGPGGNVNLDPIGDYTQPLPQP